MDLGGAWSDPGKGGKALFLSITAELLGVTDDLDLSVIISLGLNSAGTDVTPPVLRTYCSQCVVVPI